MSAGLSLWLWADLGLSPAPFAIFSSPRMSQRPSRPPPLPEKQSHAGAPHDGGDGSDMGYTVRAIAVLPDGQHHLGAEPGIEEDEAQTYCQSRRMSGLSECPVCLAGKLPGASDGVWRVFARPGDPTAPGSCSTCRAALRSRRSAPRHRSHLPFVRQRQSPAFWPQRSGCGSADQPTGFCVSQMIGWGHTRPAVGVPRRRTLLVASSDPWVALQPSAAEAPMFAGERRPAAAPSRSRLTVGRLEARPMRHRRLRPWLLSARIGPLGTTALALILSASATSGSKPGSTPEKVSRSSESSTASRDARPASLPCLRAARPGL